MLNDKLPPYDADAEDAVIGSLLIDGDAIIEVALFLKEKDFFLQQNQWIYKACLSIYERHEGINQITVAQELSQQDKLDETGGASHLSYLVSIVPTSLHITYYAQIVSRLSVMRHLISASDRIAAVGYEAEADVDAAIGKAEDILFKVRQHQRTHGDFVPLNTIINQYFEESSIIPSGNEIPYIRTGFNFLDEILLGLHRSDLIVLGARTSVGKTSLALNIARNAAINQKACVAFFSLEMSQHEVAQRLLSSESNINSSIIRRGNYSKGGEEEKSIGERSIMEASALLSEAPIYIDDTSQLRVVEMRSKARRLHYERPIDLIIVDYLQLIRGEGRSENRNQELSEITRSLKALARDLNVPLLALSQLRRPEHHQIVHKPRLSDLRDSGSIEQDADVVLFIHREEKDKSVDNQLGKHGDDYYGKDVADIIIAKNRNGPTDEGKLRFLIQTTKFVDYKEAESSAIFQTNF